VRTFGIKRTLLHFSLDGLPPGSQVERAILMLRSVSTEDTGIDVDVVGLVRAWREHEATWNAPLTGHQWASPGAEAVGVDRLGDIVAQITVSGGDRWWEWDITPLVRDWASGARPNHGLILLSRDAPKAREIAFTARESGDPPKVVIDYTGASSAEHFTLSLRKGLNLVSLPFCLSDEDLDQVFAPIADRLRRVWSYGDDDIWRSFVPNIPQSSLVSVDSFRGYWIDMRADAELTLYAGECAPSVLSLRKGWNLVGYPSLQTRDIAEAVASLGDALQVAWWYDSLDAGNPWRSYAPAAAPWSNNLLTMAPGRGYWLLVNRDYTWTLP
jgi:hypothetical protein